MNKQEAIRQILLSGAKQRLALINWKSSANGCDEYSANQLKLFAERQQPQVDFWRFISSNILLIHRVLTPALRNKFETKLKEIE